MTPGVCIAYPSSGEGVKRVFPVCSFYKNQVFVSLIRGGNCCLPAADLALFQCLCPSPTAPEALTLVMPAQRVIDDVLAVH